MHANRKWKFKDIYVEEMSTGDKIGPLNEDEAMELLGVKQVKALQDCLNRGHYKKYTLTSTPIECNETKKNDICNSTKNNVIEDKQPENVQEEQCQYSLKYCFEAMKVLVNSKDKYGFGKVDDFIYWLMANEFIENELK